MLDFESDTVVLKYALNFIMREWGFFLLLNYALSNFWYVIDSRYS